MSYLVLARKWRPQQLSELVGQDPIARTLKNAITSGRIAHAFLFTGARGVGKTSAARILAKALLCESTNAPTPTPCGTCRSCVDIAEGNATDVFEIDAASNTGVQNVREIIENVRYLPAKSRFKIYIIDEVHMLSTGAFNALLKTLEEPPPHAKFVLATTDVHKLPATIVSRCQRYDFRRISTAQITSRLLGILKDEGVVHDEKSLYAIAREAEGSMRDAQSILEQVLTFSDGRPLDAALVSEALGIADQALIDDAVDALLNRRADRIFPIVKELHERGLDRIRFVGSLVETVRDLLAVRVLDDPASVVDRPADERAKMQQLVRTVEPRALKTLFEGLCQVADSLGATAYPRFALEVGLLSLAEAPPQIPIRNVARHLERIETLLTSAPPSTTARVQASAAPGGAATSHPFRDRHKEAIVPTAVATPAPDFHAFVAEARRRQPTLASLVQVRPLAFAAGLVELGCETRFDESQLLRPETQHFLTDLLAEMFGSKTTLKVRLLSKAEAPSLPMTVAETEEARIQVVRQEKAELAQNRPAVQMLVESLGADIVRIHPLDSE